MTPDELRSAYLSFFEKKGHTVYPSAPLVPENDPTLLFTGAGMNQFKEMFLGIGNLPFKRAVTAQKCLRTADLENVGRTFYHQTFFEMLGNFSFGDYFKREAILWQWEFLTEVLRLPKESLWVSVYKDDEEAATIWRDEVKLPPERIWRLGAEENFWPANAPEEGPNGPCGPCSEIFFDYGSPGEEGDPEAGRYCEIGNVVFTQFNRVGRNELEPLRQKNIDTGMGFDRLLAVVHGVRSNFETELFLPILEATARIAGRPYVFGEPDGRLFRRIADHVRAAVFLIADGVKPSNEGRGYVARRIVRGAVRDGIEIGIAKPFLHRLVPVVVSLMGKAYPEVERAGEAARAFLKAEEEKFRETYHTGILLLERELAALEAQGKRRLPGTTAFTLYDSHGFPFDLCEEICRERGFEVDRAGFERSMERQRERSREASSIAGEVFVETAFSALKKTLPATEFLGYEVERAESVVRAILSGDKTVPSATEEDGEVGILVERTPFYAESGGQVGDTGEIDAAAGLFSVLDTQKVEGYIVHRGRVARGRVTTGDAVDLRVDSVRRAAIRRNHTATHLLHAALRSTLGTHVTQAGSLVAPDRLRFDFTHPAAVSPQDLERIERDVNRWIVLDLPVATKVRDLQEARREGAMALFGEKYADRVRVVSVEDVSMELCGGTHVGRIGEIGSLLVTQETSVASGVRRLEAVTGEGALLWVEQQRRIVRGLAETLKAAPEALESRLEALQQEVRELRRREQEERRKSGLSAADRLVGQAVEGAGVRLVAGAVEGDDVEALRALSDEVRRRLGEGAVLLAGRGEGGITLVAAATAGAVKAGISAGDLLRRCASRLGGKGGGRPQMAQGRAPAGGDVDGALEGALQETLHDLTAR